MDIVKSNRLPCNQCLTTTQHSVRGEHIQSSCEGYGEATVTKEMGFQILECNQCRTVSFREFVHFSEYSEYPGDFDPEDIFHPPRAGRKTPEWIQSELTDSPKIQKLLLEFYKARNAKLPWLAAIGARTIFDCFAEKTIGDVGNFDQKLDSLCSKKHISQEERDRLGALVEAGNAAAHRGYHPSDKEIDIITDILEATIHRYFVETKKLTSLGIAAQEMKNNVPKRSNIKRK